MEQYLVEDLLEICRAMGISAGSAKTREAILEVMRAKNVTAEEADEFWVLICEKSREELEAQRHEQWKAEESIKRKEHALRIKELDHKIEEIKWQPVQYQLEFFRMDENIVHFLVSFEKFCDDVGVGRDLWSEKLATLLPCKVTSVLERLSAEEAHDFDRVKHALFRHFAALSAADCESRA